jgi:starch phosphorylase
MKSQRTTAGARTAHAPDTKKLLEQYGCGPIQFTGTADALYERHLLFDNVVDPPAVGARERYEAVARSVRDVLSQRWVRTEKTYERLNPKRVYYLSMEFLIGRSLANNIMNLLLDREVQRVVADKGLDWLGVLEQEPDAGLGNGGLGRLAACFLDSMATMQLPAMGYGLRYEYGIFKQAIDDGWQREQPDNWLRQPDPWEVARPYEKVEIKMNCAVEVRAGTLQPVIGRTSNLIGLPFDRPVVGYGGKTINTLRLWAAAAPESFDFQAFSHGEFVSALAERRAAESLTRVLYPDDSTSRSTFSSRAHWRTWCGASVAAMPTGTRFPRRSPFSSTTPIRRWPCPSSCESSSTRRTSAGTRPGISPGRRSLTRITRSCPRRSRSGRCRGSRCCSRAISRSSWRSTGACSTRSGPGSRATADGWSA